MRWLCGRGKLPADFVRADGWVDLVGLDLTAAAHRLARAKSDAYTPDMQIKFARRRWRKVDFRGCKMSGLLFQKMRFEDCIFDGADLRDTRWAGCTVERSMFRRADLRDVYLSIRWFGMTRPSRWTDCDFTGAKYSGDGMDTTVFTRCRLTFASWLDIRMRNCRFVNCEFAGRMNRVQFDSRPIQNWFMRAIWHRSPVLAPTFEDVNFENADLYDVQFSGCSFKGVKWSPQHWLLEVPEDGPVMRHLARMKAELTGDVGRMVSGMFRADMAFPSRPGSTLFFNLGIFRDESDEFIESFVNVLRRAAVAVGGPDPVVHGHR
jgi:uncharacterized protein YjbI with pentapeptide repeats